MCQRCGDIFYCGDPHHPHLKGNLPEMVEHFRFENREPLAADSYERKDWT
jgi:hypothetical protein